MNIKQIIKNSRLYPRIIRLIYPSKSRIAAGNKIIFGKSIIKNCRFEICGRNNEVLFEDIHFLNSTIRISGDNNVIRIGSQSFLQNATLHIEDSSGAILLGSNVSICGKTDLSVIEGTIIKIGDGCLFSSNVMMATGDSHSIIDTDTKHRLNPSKNISIGNRVWFGHDTTVLKGVNLSDDTIVGACTVVTKSVPDANVALAGIPAKIVRENVYWSFDRV